MLEYLSLLFPLQVLKYKEADDGEVVNFVSLLGAELSTTHASVAATQFVIEAISNLVESVKQNDEQSPSSFLLAVISRLADKGDLCCYDIQESLNALPSLLPARYLVFINCFYYLSVVICPRIHNSEYKDN